MSNWISRYIAALPNHIRPHPDDTRLKAAAHQAEANGWPADQAANVIASHNYQGKAKPTLIAIMELETVAQHPPQRSHDQPKPMGCHRCDHGWIDNETTTSPCPDCRPQLAARLARIPQPGHRTHADIAHIRADRTAN